ncbi:MAG: branched-chain amino acid ABC transporter permease [Deltaproteobacteria bacterium]|nr:branched-chain amino acid ABC transporter permease [Deltaproteobacteria bacterium]
MMKPGVIFNEIAELAERKQTRIILWLIAAVVLTVLPGSLSAYSRRLVIEMLIFAIYAMSFDLMLGYLGLISFGHSSFWGAGAYIVGILVANGTISNFGSVLLIGVVLSLLLGVFFGFLVMRSTEIYFTLLTLALSQALLILSIKWSSLTGGIDGICGITRPWNLGGTGFYYFILAFFVICFILMRWITNARYGRILIGIRENESRMKAMGYNAWAFKYSAYVIAGIFGSIAGMLSAYHNKFVSPEDFAFTITGTALLMVLIGGKASQMGSFIGAVIVVLLYRIVSTYTEHWLLVVGIVFVLIVLFARQGFVGYISELRKKVSNEGLDY